MRKYVFVLLCATLFALLVFAALTAGAVSRWIDERTAHNAAMHLIRERQAAAFADVVAPSAVLLRYGVSIGVCVAIGLILAGATDAWRNHAAQLIAIFREWLYLRGLARIERAKAKATPPHIYHEHGDRRPPVIDVVQPPALPPPPPDLPTFPALLDAGALAHGNRLLLGIAEDGPRYGALEDISATGVPGKRGTGKTTTERFLGAQMALAGARFVILDPHINSEDESLASTLSPLHHCFLHDPAGDDRTILRNIQYVAAELERRVQGRSSDRTIIVVLIDEWTRLMKRSAIARALAKLLAAINEEGRKFGVFAVIAGQVWTRDEAGGTEVKESVASFFVHRMSRHQARLLLPARDAHTAESLRRGECLFHGPDGETVKLQIPNTTHADIEQVAKLLPKWGSEALQHAHESARYTARKSAHKSARYDHASNGASAASETHKNVSDMLTLKRTEAPASLPAVVVSEAERRDILSAAREPGDDGNPPSRRTVCMRVFKTTGGANYDKVKRVLDELGNTVASA